MPTVSQQIEEVVKNITTREDRIEAIEKSLRLDDLDLNNRNNVEEERIKLMKEVRKLKKELQSLRLENMKTMFVSLVFLGAGYGVYYYFFHHWTPLDEQFFIQATSKKFQSAFSNMCTVILVP